MTNEGVETVCGYPPQSRHSFVSLVRDGTAELERAALDSPYCLLPTFSCAPLPAQSSKNGQSVSNVDAIWPASRNGTVCEEGRAHLSLPIQSITTAPSLHSSSNYQFATQLVFYCCSVITRHANLEKEDHNRESGRVKKQEREP